MSRPILHLDSASCLPPAGIPGTGPQRLAAMAHVPYWLRDVTHGRPEGCYAEGGDVALLHAALVARDRPLFASQAPVAAYRAALDARWSGLVASGAFAPGRLEWATHRAENLRTVADGAWLVCTCARGVECHLGWLSVHLDAAGWSVVYRGEPFVRVPEPTPETQ